MDKSSGVPIAAVDVTTDAPEKFRIVIRELEKIKNGASVKYSICLKKSRDEFEITLGDQKQLPFLIVAIHPEVLLFMAKNMSDNKENLREFLKKEFLKISKQIIDQLIKQCEEFLLSASPDLKKQYSRVLKMLKQI